MKYFVLALFLMIISESLRGSDKNIKLVSKNASPEATALLKLIYDISGNYILTGQHNYPDTKDRNTKFARSYTGKTPVIFSTDWGFAKQGDKDSYLSRPDIVEEAKKQHKMGALITICWHAVPPTTIEPVTFQPPAGYSNADSLISVQGQLTDKQFQDLLTPGTKIYNNWCSQVDTIAFYLKQLQAAHVPVLWRPYHEMNGKWFWWGQRTGKYSTAALYKQLFDRLVNFHKINNLIWVWSVDRFHGQETYYSKYFPGSNYADILAVDIYGNDFNKIYYDSLKALSKGKPITLGEVGNPPSLEIINNQPLYAYYVIWSGMVRNSTQKTYKVLFSDRRVLAQEDSTYRRIISQYRQICSLPALADYTKSYTDFTGEWIIDEDRSSTNAGFSSLPYKLLVSSSENDIKIGRIYIEEFADNRIVDEVLKTNGEETKSKMMNAPKTTIAKFSANKDTLQIESIVRFNSNDSKSDMVSKENWYLEDDNTLSILFYSKSSWGERKSTVIFRRCGKLKYLD